MKIYLLRHGESEGNRLGVLCGWKDMPLTERGREQALAAREKIRGIRFDGIYSSPLCRALETARIVADGQEVTVEEGFRERGMGALEGITWEEAERRYPDVAAAWPGDPVRFAPPGGESTLELFERCGRAVEELMARKPGARHLLIVSHGAALACVIAYLLGKQPENAFRYRLDNCTLAVVQIMNGFAILERLD